MSAILDFRLSIRVPLGEFFELLFQGSSSSVQSGPNRTDGDFEDFGDVFVGEVLHFAKYQYRAVVFGQQGQGSVDELDVFVAAYAQVGSIAIEFGFSAGVFAGLVEGLVVFASSSSCQGEVERDAVEPGEKAAIALEGIELEVGLDERFLDDVFGFVGASNDADHGRVEAVLVAEYQGFEGSAFSGECQLDQFVFVVHSLGSKGDRRKSRVERRPLRASSMMNYIWKIVARNSSQIGGISRKTRIAWGFWLLVPQGVDRIELAGPPSRVKTESYSDAGREDQADEGGPVVDDDRPVSTA